MWNPLPGWTGWILILSPHLNFVKQKFDIFKKILNKINGQTSQKVNGDNNLKTDRVYISGQQKETPHWF
jgi:hypothetical protein